MKLEGVALRLAIFDGESDTWHHKPPYHEVVHRAHRAGPAAASMVRGIEGPGASSGVHTMRILALSEDLQLAIVILNAESEIRAFPPQLDGPVAEGLVILDPVQVVRYAGRGADRTARLEDRR
ncbi:DUF190 domain-containing protein [Spirillospora sp. CA-255316]